MTSVGWNGSTYAVPSTGEDNWGGSTKVDGLLIALATHGFQKSGGLFTLSADADFGASAGLKSNYYKSRGTVASAGVLRLAAAETIAWLNNAGSGNNTLTTNASDALVYNGVAIVSSSGLVAVAAGGTGLSSYTTGDMLYASGATTLAKLGIGAANRVQVSTGSAPSWALIADANIDAAAAITRSKIAAGTASHVVIHDGSGLLSSEAALSAVRGGTGVANNAACTTTRSGNFALTITLSNTTSVTFPTTGTLATLAGAESFSNKTFSDPQTWAHNATPSNPSAGNVKVYAKSDNLLYVLTSGGSELVVTAASEKTDPKELTNLSLAASVGSSAITVSLKTKAGTDPSSSDVVKIAFRNSTASTGTYVQRSVTSSLSVTVSSGSTLGHTSAVAEYIYVYAIDNAGTVELAVSSSRIWDENTLQTTTAEGGAGAADSRVVLYSTTARSNVAVRLIGRLKVTEATAGTWATAPSEISPVMPGPLAFRSEVLVHTGNGYGATSTKIRRWTTTDRAIGSAITYSDNANTGGLFTINEEGTYGITRTDRNTGAGFYMGISRNTAGPSTVIDSIPVPTRLAMSGDSSTSYTGFSWCGRLYPGDLIRAHDGSVCNSADDTSNFWIIKVAD